MFHLLVLHVTPEQKAAVKNALANAGHDLKEDAVSEVTKLETAAQTAYPALVSAFKTGFDEVEHDESVQGIAKMEKVVLGILPQVPAIAGELANLSNLKSFLFQMGQTLFTDGLADLKQEAETLVPKLLTAA